MTNRETKREKLFTLNYRTCLNLLYLFMLFVFVIFIFNTRILSVLDAFWTSDAIVLTPGWFVKISSYRVVSIGNLWLCRSRWASRTCQSRPGSQESTLSSPTPHHDRTGASHLKAHMLCTPTTIGRTEKSKVLSLALRVRRSPKCQRAPLWSHRVWECVRVRNLWVWVWLGRCCQTSWCFLVSNLCG